jgi:hypothetical protein
VVSRAAAGDANALLGSIDAAGLPRIGWTSIARRSPPYASLQKTSGGTSEHADRRPTNSGLCHQRTTQRIHQRARDGYFVGLPIKKPDYQARTQAIDEANDYIFFKTAG